MDVKFAKINDLLASAKTVCDRYEKGRMERETVREWSCVSALIHHRMAIACERHQSGLGLTPRTKPRAM